MPEWRVYSRAGCCLCEQMLEELAQLLGAAATHVQVVDIGSDAELERKYGSRIPVLMADGEFVCAYHLDHQRLQYWLDGEHAVHRDGSTMLPRDANA
jgi:hypothetical protein